MFCIQDYVVFLKSIWNGHTKLILKIWIAFFSVVQEGKLKVNVLFFYSDFLNLVAQYIDHQVLIDMDQAL
jgi:hypothetical protein